MSFRRAALVTLAAFLVRAGYLLAMGDGTRYAWAPDSADYAAAAKGLYRFETFTRSEEPPLQPETFRTPGYPLLLALTCSAETCPDERQTLWIQAFLGAAACAFVFWSALLLFGDPRAATIAGLLLAADPVTVMHAGLMLTETAFTAAFCAAFLALAWAWKSGSRGGAFGAGALLGLAALVRPAGLYAFLFVGPALAFAWKGRGRAAAAALLAAGALLLPVAWALRNKAQTGVFTFTSIQGLNVTYMRAAAVEMQLSGSDYETAVKSLDSRVDAAGAASGGWAARFILSHPLAYAKAMAKDAVKMLGGHGLEIFSWTVLHDEADDPMSPRPPSGQLSGTRELLTRHPRLWAPLILGTAFLAGLYLLALRGLLAGERGPAVLTAVPALYFLAVSCGALAYYRFRLPLMPAVCILAGLGAAGRQRLPAGSSRS